MYTTQLYCESRSEHNGRCELHSFAIGRCVDVSGTQAGLRHEYEPCNFPTTLATRATRRGRVRCRQDPRTSRLSARMQDSTVRRGPLAPFSIISRVHSVCPSTSLEGAVYAIPIANRDATKSLTTNPKMVWKAARVSESSPLLCLVRNGPIPTRTTLPSECYSLRVPRAAE